MFQIFMSDYARCFQVYRHNNEEIAHSCILATFRSSIKTKRYKAKIDGLVEVGAIGNSITYSCAYKNLENMLVRNNA